MHVRFPSGRSPPRLVALGAATLAVPLALGASNPPISVVSPTNGSTVTGSKVTLTIKAKPGFKFTDQGTAVKPNEGHVHVVLDKRPFVALYSTKFVFRGVKAGNHTLTVQPVRSDHMPHGLKPIVVKFTSK